MSEGLWLLREMFERRKSGGSLKDFYIDDPISFPKRFTVAEDVETAALIAAMFAIGPRYAILRSLERIFAELGKSPYRSLISLDPRQLLKRMDGHIQFAYKNITGKDVVQILYATRMVLHSHDTIQGALRALSKNGDGSPRTILTGLLEMMKSVGIPASLGGELTPRARSLLASPKEGSACKRMNMFLRWMTRKDDIDFGLYDWLGTDRLIVPLDVNVSRAARKLRLTSRKTDNWKTAEEITEKLRVLDPVDPVKYDVPLFLYGIELRKKTNAA